MIPAYPNIREKDNVLFYLAKTHQYLNEEDEARITLERLRTDYPESAYMDKVERLLDGSPDGKEDKNGN